MSSEKLVKNPQFNFSSQYRMYYFFQMRWKSNPTWCLLFHRIWGGKLVFHYVWIQSCTAIQKRFQIEFCCYLSALKKSFVSLTNTYMGVCSFFIVKLISRNFTTGHCIYLDHNKSALSECGALHWVCVWRPSIATCEVKF